jgi:(p)ppGpp synthase/HD superfamily hydrolase
MTYGPRAREALLLAFDLHANQNRKGRPIPYITHLLAVAAIVGENGGDEDQFIAALLHDAVEDQGGAPMLENIRARFGNRVAALVAACTDTDQSPKPPWRARKEAYLAAVPEKSPEEKLIIAADKLHNARAIRDDLRREGIATLDRFTGGREGTLWYHRAITDALAKNWPHPLVEELRATVRAIESHCAATEQPCA